MKGEICMKTQKTIQKNNAIYLYDWYHGRFVCKYTWESFGETILNNDYQYAYYLEHQNASGDDMYSFVYDEFVSSLRQKQFSFCRYDKDDNYIIVNIKDLLNDWKRENRAPIDDCKSTDDEAYLSNPDFRKGPVKGLPCYYRTRVTKTIRRVKHTRMILNELSRIPDDNEWGCYSSRQDLMSYACMDWDYTYRMTNRSWKDQTKKKRQWS